MTELTDDDLIDAAEIGQAVRDFVESDAGKSLIAMCEADALEAMEHLGTTDPDDTKQIVRWQIELKAARKLKQKLETLISMGDNALEAWRHSQDES